jgi:DNA polymerase
MSDRFNVCDLNAIESRVGAWLAQCQSLMNVFQPEPGLPNGRCPYISFASKMYGIPYEKLWADYKGKNGKPAQLAAKRMRQISKPAVLAAVYRQSGGGWGYAKKGYKDHGDNCDASELIPGTNKKVGKKHCLCETIHDKIKTGLWGYAEGMGVEMSQEQAVSSVRIFRESYEEIPNCWYAIENAVQDVMRGTDTVRYIGPNDCVKIDKLNITGRGAMLRMRLPSGRYLHYLDARLESCKMPWQKDGQDVYRDSLVYAGTNADTKQWELWTQTHGGHLFQNLVQGIARDILAVKLMMFEEADMPVCGHVHDEGVCIVPDDPFSPTVEDQVRIMSQEVSWAKGLLLGADGFQDTVYHK